MSLARSLSFAHTCTQGFSVSPVIKPSSSAYSSVSSLPHHLPDFRPSRAVCQASAISVLCHSRPTQPAPPPPPEAALSSPTPTTTPISTTLFAAPDVLLSLTQSRTLPMLPARGGTMWTSSGRHTEGFTRQSKRSHCLPESCQSLTRLTSTHLHSTTSRDASEISIPSGKIFLKA